MMINDENAVTAAAEAEKEQPAVAPAPTDAAEVPASNDPAPAAPVASDAVPAVSGSENDAENKPVVETADDLDLFDAAMKELDITEARTDTGRRLNKGDRLEATVIQVEDERVFVDLGTKTEGLIPLSELTDDPITSAKELVKVGDVLTVVVIKPAGNDNSTIVSKKRADFDEAWHRVVSAFNSGEMLTAQVVDRVKGGLLVDVGVRGFVPATHVGSGRLRNIEKYVGETLSLKVIEIDRDRKKVVLSNREAEALRREEIKEGLFNTAEPGQILEGVVRRLTDYGAFVDLGGIDGLLHISEMSWMRISHPSEVLKEGQEIKVMVLKLDPSIGKISLGLRQVLPDPWKLVKENYQVGQKITLTINRMVQSGAFIRLPEGAEAFLPVSEISHKRINKPSDVLAENQEVELTIIDLRPDERRMVLSLKAGTDAPADQQIGYGYSASPAEYDPTRRGGGPDRGGPRRKGKGGPRDDRDSNRGGGGATIGERLGILKGFHFRSEEDADASEGSPAEGTEASAPEATESQEESKE